MAAPKIPPSSIINQIADNLRDRYDGPSILKEIIQNTDDAGGKPFISLEFGFSPKGVPAARHSLLQGPGLFFLNDGEFTAKDYESVQSFALNHKAADRSTIGKFGLGMKSVFHFCEAFFYLAKGMDGEFRGIYNPWSGCDESNPRSRSWDEFDQDKDEQQLLLEYLAPIYEKIPGKSDSWFLLWLPLRKESHLYEGPPIISEYPGDNGKLIQFLDEPDLPAKLAELLPLLKRLGSIRYWSGDDASFAIRFHVSLDHGTHRLVGVGENGLVEGALRKLEGRSSETVFIGNEHLFVSSDLLALRESRHWPQSLTRDKDGRERKAEDKNEGHAAVVFSRRLQRGQGELRIRWAVFLPLKGGEEDLSCLGECSYLLTLHGYFFVDAGRKGIDGFGDEVSDSLPTTDESELRRQWNQRLINEAVLPLVLPSLEKFVQQAALSPDEVVNLCQSLNQSKLFKKYRDGICTESQFVAVRDRMGITWKLLPTNSPVLPLPPPPQTDQQRPWVVFPALAEIERERGYTLVDADAPSLRVSPSLPQWNQLLLEMLLDGVSADIFADLGLLDYFCAMLTSDRVRPVAIQQRLRHILAAAFATHSEIFRRRKELQEKIKQVVSLINKDNRLAIPKVPKPFSFLYELSIEVLLVPEDFDASDKQCEAKLTRKDAAALLRALDRLVREAEVSNLAEQQKDCRKLIRLVIENLNPTDRLAVLQQLEDLHLVEVHDCLKRGRRTISLAELKKVRNTGLLFQFSLGSGEAALGLAPFLQGAINEQVFVIKSEMGQLLFDTGTNLSPCTHEACLESLGRSAKKFREKGIPNLLRHLAGADTTSVIQRRGLRYLLHGNQSHFDDTATPLWVRSNEVPPAWGKMWQQVQVEHSGDSGWNLIKKERVDHIPQGQWNAIGIREIKPEAILDEVIQRGTAMLDGTKLALEERNEILAHIQYEKQLWLDLPFHETLTGSPVRVTDKTYLAGSLPLPDALTDLAVVIKQSADSRIERQQNEWLSLLDQRRIAKIALTHQKPSLFWQEIMAALTGGGLRLFDKRAREIRWLPTLRGQTIAPENVILLPEIEDELDRLAAQEQDSYLPLTRLSEKVRSTPGFEALQSLFSADEDALEKLGLLLDGKDQYFLGEFSPKEDEGQLLEHLEILAASPVNLSFPGWRLLQRLGVKHGIALVVKHVSQALFQPIDGQRLVALLQWLKKEHETGPKSEKTKRLAAYNWTLSAFARSRQARSLLPEVSLLNSERRWRMATELCTNVVGVAKQHILADEHKDLIVDIITETHSASQVDSATAGDVIATDLTLTEDSKAPSFDEWKIIRELLQLSPERVHEFLTPWVGQIASEAICFFLCLLGNHHILTMHELAEKYRGRHSSLMWYRENTPWVPYDGQKAEEFGQTAEEVISKHGFIVDIIPGDQPVEVKAITGQPLTVFPEQEIESLVVGERPLGFWPRLDLRVVRLRLRCADTEKITEKQFSTALKKTAEYILETVYDQPVVNLDTIWEELDSSEQLDIRVAEELILENIPFYLKQLSVHKRQEQLREVLQKWDDARLSVAEYSQDEKNTKKRDEFAKQKQKYLRELQILLKDDDATQTAALEAVRAKMKDFQYEPASVPFELFQNADDATAEQTEIEAYRSQQPSIEVALPDHCRRFIVIQGANHLSFINWGRPINSTGSGNFPGRERGYHQDMEKMLILSSSDKESGKVTGKFGLGFKSVLLVCDRPRLVSGRLGFEVVAGMCPAKLDSDKREEIRSRLASVSGADRQRPGTLVDLPLVSEATPKAVLDRFCSLAGGLVVFARQIRTIEIRGDGEKATRAEWAPEILLEQDDCRVERGELLAPFVHETKLSALYFRCGNGGLLLGFGPRGFRKLPDEMPAIWVVAPTKEDSGLGIAVNGEFDLDAGRIKLSGTIEANIQKARALGQPLAAGFAAFHAKAMNWPKFVDHARLEADITPYEFWYSFWEVLTYALSREKSSARDLIRDALTGDYGLGKFIASKDRQVLPTGLWNDHAVLTRPRQVAWVLRGLLADEQVFRKATGIKAVVEKAAPGQVISEMVHTALSRVLPEHGQKRDQWASLRVQDVVAWTVDDDNQVTPKTAGELGGLLSEDLLTQHHGKEIEDETNSLREYLGKLFFQAESGHWVKAGVLLVRVSGIHAEHDDESKRAGFAPTDRRLSSKYGGKAVAFFRLCRKQMKAPVENMVIWIREAKGDEERRAVLLYLRDGGEKWKLLESLRNDGLQSFWLSELNENSPYFSGWTDEERDELLLRGLPPLADLRDNSGPSSQNDKPKLPPPDPREVLPAIYDWWQNEWPTYISSYELRVYGGSMPDFSMNDTGRFNRSAWLTLFLLGAFHTMGRTTPHQHRGFIELCNQRGWWQIFSAERPRERASEWMRVLEEYFDQQIDSSEYEQWFKQFGSIYRFARHLDDYVEAFSSMDRPGVADLNQRAILAPRASNIFQGGGIDAPPLARALGKGFCFVLRELRRKNILRHPGLTPYCFVPVGRVRRLLDFLGAVIGQPASPLDQSKAIHDFLAAHLGPERACFGGDYDIPLQIVAENVSIQERFFNGKLDFNELDEEAYPHLGMDTEEIDQ